MRRHNTEPIPRKAKIRKVTNNRNNKTRQRNTFETSKQPAEGLLIRHMGIILLVGIIVRIAKPAPGYLFRHKAGYVTSVEMGVSFNEEGQ
jgi:hypothetical protein